MLTVIRLGAMSFALLIAASALAADAPVMSIEIDDSGNPLQARSIAVVVPQVDPRNAWTQRSS
jgi:hypothetical protein